jgi:hypothetical protein
MFIRRVESIPGGAADASINIAAIATLPAPECA